MTQEQKRIKIAEKVGWKFHPPTEHLYSEQEKAEAIMCWVRPGNGPWQMERVPDYFNNLNAMHEAENTLSGSDGAKYRHKLMLNSDGPKARYLTTERALCHATAAERAEAFGKALNLW